MSFRIDPAAPLDADVRRIAGEQIDKAIAQLGATSSGGDRDTAIHDVRKRMKKLRALFRLVRHGDTAFYRQENARLRDGARLLSSARDRTALIEALDSLAQDVPASLSTEAVGAAFAPLRQDLLARREEAENGQGSTDVLIAGTIDTLEASRAALDGLGFPRAKSRAVASAGFAATHAAARSALKVAEKTGSAEDLHLLRKHVKYLGFHLALLSPLWPEAFAPLRQAAGDIADDLGRDHDFAVLRDEIGAGQHPLVLALMDRRQAELQGRGLVLARRLLAEKPVAVETRIARLYRNARQGTVTQM